MVDKPAPDLSPGRTLKWAIGVAIVAAISTAAFMVLSPAEGEVTDVKLFADSRPAPDPVEGDPPLRVLVSSMVSPGWTLELYDRLARRLGAAVGRRGVLVQRRNYTEANDAVRHADVDIAFVCSGAYVKGERDGVNARLVAVPVVRGRSTYRSFLVVPSASAARKLEDLRGKRVTYVDPTSLTGAAYLRHRVATLGATDGAYFERINYSGSHDRSVQAVARGLTDAAPVDNLIYEMMAEADPTLRAKIRIIERSDPFGAPPIVVPGSTPAPLQKALLQALTEMHEDPQSKPLLAALHIDRFDAVAPEHYDAVRAVWDSTRR